MLAIRVKKPYGNSWSWVRNWSLSAIAITPGPYEAFLFSSRSEAERVLDLLKMIKPTYSFKVVPHINQVAMS